MSRTTGAPWWPARAPVGVHVEGGVADGVREDGPAGARAGVVADEQNRCGVVVEAGEHAQRAGSAPDGRARRSRSSGSRLRYGPVAVGDEYGG